jgi:hypothetical protein
MKATDFEYRHRTLLHLSVVGVAFLTYLPDRDDIVWRFVRDSPSTRVLERVAFAVAAILIGAGAGLCTWVQALTRSDGSSESGATIRMGPSRCFRYQYSVGEFIFAVGLATLAPLWGFVILVGGEAIRIGRLILRERALGRTPAREGVSTDLVPASQPERAAHFHTEFAARRDRVVRREGVKWGLFFIMTIFAITLVDRDAEAGALASVLLWALLNLRNLIRKRASAD